MLNYGELFCTRDVFYEVANASGLDLVEVVYNAGGGDKGKAPGVSIPLPKANTRIWLTRRAYNNEVDSLREAGV